MARIGEVGCAERLPGTGEGGVGGQERLSGVLGALECRSGCTNGEVTDR
jgi:hypothetical protein